MELREKYGMWPSECKVPLYKQTFHISTQNSRITRMTSESLHVRSAWSTFRGEQYLICDVVPVCRFISEQWNLGNISYLSCASILFIGNIKKAIYRAAGLKSRWENLSFAFIKLREMSIGRVLLTQRILWRPFYKTRPSICDHVHTRDIGCLCATCPYDSRTSVE